MKKFIVFAFMVLFSVSTFSQTKTTHFVIKTKLGNIIGKLYNDTPLHRDNFIKLVGEGWYDSSRFHRVINGFMIQGGANKDGQMDPGYLIPAEIKSNHYHKRGALGAARTGDDVNPERKSSGCQFYIIQGRRFKDDELDAIEERFDITFSEEQRHTYRGLGGAPHLDETYTVFGEITRGMNVVDKIAAVPCEGTQPINPVIIDIELVEY